MWMPDTCSTVRTSSSGPPCTSAALILFVPEPGIDTHESRGIPRIETRPRRGLTPTMWIESARAFTAERPGRASLPITRTNRGPFEGSPGANAACAGWGCSCSGRGVRPRTS